MFPNNTNDNYIITSRRNKSGKDEDSETKIFLFNEDCKFIKYINNTNKNPIYYLLSWHNKENNKYYIIQFSDGKIMINSLLEEELYFELINEFEAEHFSGSLFNKKSKDYLCSSSSNGYVNIWDLYNKKLFKSIRLKGYLENHELAHIIEWNKQFIFVADYGSNKIFIFDIENNYSIIDIKSRHKYPLKCIKKINHTIYGESFLSAAEDQTIKLWIIK